VVVYAVVNLVLWGFWALTSGMGGFPWPGLLTLAWGSGIAANWLELRYKAPQRFVALEHSVQAQMARVYGPDWEAVASGEDYQRVFQAVDKAARERQEFAIHAAVYVMINLMLWFIWAAAQSPAEFPFPLLVMGGWGIGLAAHGATVFFSSARQQLAREEAIEREVERWAGQEARVAKKKKRDSSARLELSDDGELIEIVDESWDADARRSREG
jgi:hypothetical protein